MNATKELTPYERMCLPFKQWEAEFNAMPESERIGPKDVGRQVRYLASDGTEQFGYLDAYDPQSTGIGCIRPAKLIQRYRMRRV